MTRSILLALILALSAAGCATMGAGPAGVKNVEAGGSVQVRGSVYR